MGVYLWNNKYEYSCDFRNSSQSAIIADWWSIKTWTPTFSANGISSSDTLRVFKEIPTLTSTSKVKLKCWFSLPSNTSVACSLTEAYSTWSYKSNLGGSYIDGVTQTQYIIGQTVYYLSVFSGTWTWEMNIDLENNTATYSNSLYNSWAVQTKTINATEKASILLTTNIRIMTNRGIIQDLSITIEE